MDAARDSTQYIIPFSAVDTSSVRNLATTEVDSPVTGVLMISITAKKMVVALTIRFGYLGCNIAIFNLPWLSLEIWFPACMCMYTSNEIFLIFPVIYTQEGS